MVVLMATITFAAAASVAVVLSSSELSMWKAVADAMMGQRPASTYMDLQLAIAYPGMLRLALSTVSINYG